MPVIKIVNPTGEVPRVPTQALPDNAAESAIDCDFAQVELKGLKQAETVSTMPNLNNEVMVDIWTNNGQDFFAWPWPVSVVRGPVVNDKLKRIYYSGLPNTGPVLKVARTYREDGTKVINSPIVGGNFKPPEASNEVVYGGTGLGPDAWLVGSWHPRAQDGRVNPLDPESELMTIEAIDAERWPAMPGMRLRVTYFIEAPDGRILWQGDISNNEGAKITVAGVDYTTYPQVFWSNVANTVGRGNKIQDMLWPLSYIPRPYKYYFFEPPAVDEVALGRTVTVTNEGPAVGSFTYGTSEPDTGESEGLGGIVA